MEYIPNGKDTPNFVNILEIKYLRAVLVCFGTGSNAIFLPYIGKKTKPFCQRFSKYLRPPQARFGTGYFLAHFSSNNHN